MWTSSWSQRARWAGAAFIWAWSALGATTAAQDVSMEEAVALLEATDAEQVRSGIEHLGLSGQSGAVEPLAARIRQGLPPALLDAAVDTLAVLARPEAGPVLFELARHRRADVRQKAVQAIATCAPEGAESVLVGALSDGDEPVRAAAALGLGELGARGAAPSLFLALDRNVLEAATAIGQLGGKEHVSQLLGYVGRLPFDALTPALSEMLARDDLARSAKLEIVARLQELATPEVKIFLQDFIASLPPGKRGGDAVRRAAEDVVLRIAD